MANKLYVGGEQVTGRWSTARGSGPHWVGLREPGSGPDFPGPDFPGQGEAGSWWWGYEARPQELDIALDQPPASLPTADTWHAPSAWATSG